LFLIDQVGDQAPQFGRVLNPVLGFAKDHTQHAEVATEGLQNVGINAPGKRNIEGLLPDSITTAMYSTSPALVQAVAHGTKSEQESARSSLKRLLLEEFKKNATPGQEYFGNFYPLVKIINSAVG
jgi:hypothetical protein